MNTREKFLMFAVLWAAAFWLMLSQRQKHQFRMVQLQTELNTLASQAAAPVKEPAPKPRAIPNLLEVLSQSKDFHRVKVMQIDQTGALSYKLLLGGKFQDLIPLFAYLDRDTSVYGVARSEWTRAETKTLQQQRWVEATFYLQARK